MYYIYYNSKEYGPYTEDQIRAMIACGKISPTVLVFQQGGDQKWQPARNIPTLMRPPAKQGMKWVIYPSDSIAISSGKELEKTVWEGRPSHLMAIEKYLKYLLIVMCTIALYLLSLAYSSNSVHNYIRYLLSCILMSILLRSCWVWLVLKSTKWCLTSERFIYNIGVFSKTTENMELYRVKDIRVRKPLFYRIFGYGFIDLVTSDKSDPILPNIGAVKNPEDLFELLRKYIERQKKKGPVKGFEII